MDPHRAPAHRRARHGDRGPRRGGHRVRGRRHPGVELEQRITVRDSRFTNIKLHSARISLVVLDGIEIDGLDARPIPSGLSLTGCLLRHVVLTGPIRGDIRVSSNPRHFNETYFGDRARHATINAEFWAGVDWAVDVSGAELAENPFRDVALDLIRRDPAKQPIVPGPAFDAEGWRALDLPRASELDLVPTQAELLFPPPPRKLDRDRWMEIVADLHERGYVR